MADLGQAYVQIVPSADGISGAIAKVLDPEADSAGRSAGTKVGGGIADFAKKAVVALGVGKTISDSISNGMNFESMSAKASTLFSGTAKEFQGLQKEIMGISSETGVAASELMNAAYSAESASVPMGNLGGMIKASSQLATAGFTDIDTALSATAKTMNAYGMMSDDVAATQANMEAVQRVLIQTQNKGITTVGELGASLAQVTPAAAAAGVNFEQVGASLAVMTAQGTPTAQATTQLRSAIAELSKSGTKASTALSEAAQGTKYAGMSFTEMMASGADLSDVMGMLQKHADDSGVSMLDLWSSIEGGNAAMTIAANADTFSEDLKAMGTSADVVGDAYSKMSETASFKLQKLKNTLTNMGISAFSASADVFAKALEGIQKVIDAISPGLSKLGTSFSKLFSKIGGYIADLLGLENGMSAVDTAIAVLEPVINGLATVFNFLADHIDIIIPVLAGLTAGFVAFKTISGVMTLATTISGIITTVSGLAAAAGGLIPLITGLISPMGIAVVVIGVLVAAGIALYKNWDTVKAFAAKTWNAIKTNISNVVNGIKSTVTSVWNAIKTTISNVLNGIKTTVTNVWNSIKTAVSNAVNKIKSTVTIVWNAIKSAVTSVVNGIRSTVVSVWNAIKSAVSSAVNGIKSTVTSVWNAIKSTVTSVMNGVKSTISNAWNSAKSSVSGAINGIKSTISSGLNSARSTVTSIFNSIKSKITSIMNGAKNAVSSAINAIKNKFHFSWSLPKLKLPHISVSGKFSINPPSTPKFGISWKKEGAIIDGASIVGVGEAGPEAIVPLSGRPMRPFAAAIAEELGGRDGDREVLELLREYLPMLANMKMVMDSGVLVGQLAPAMDARMGTIAARRSRGN